MDIKTRQKINKEIENINNNIDQWNQTNIYRILYAIGADYTFFSSTHKTYSKKDHMLGHK